MKLKNIGLSLAVVSALGLGFTGCGSSSSDTPVTTTETGTFVDAPVQGLKYTTATQSGYTNDKGEFKYVAGETVEFKLGNLSLGTKAGSTLMTPYTLGDSNTTNPSAKTTNIAMLLQSLDGNRSNGNILDLSKLKDFVFSDINLTSTANDMENTVIPSIVSNITSHASFGASFLDSNTTVISATNAINAMKSFVEAEQNSRTISVANGFGAKWLDGRTIYSVCDNTIQSFKFENNIQTVTPASTLQFPYTITADGILKVDESVDSEKTIDSANRYQKYKILSIDNTKILTCSDDGAVLENCDTEDNQQWFFTNKTDAQTYVYSL
jgi:hypothetical protein